jgi:hypothetical protein
MRAIFPTTILLATAESAFAHALDGDHSILEQLAHQFGAPHHVLMLLGLVIALAAAHRYVRSRRQGND